MPPEFLQKDVCEDGERHLIFATPLQLQYLQRAKVWFVDGTFRVVREPFHQLLSIHSFFRTGDAQKQFPLLFVLMSRRRKRDYTAVFNALVELLPEAPAVEEVVVDFERAVWSALKYVLPDVEVCGCGFHWAQAIYRKVCLIMLINITFSFHSYKYYFNICIRFLIYINSLFICFSLINWT